ncbi:hypothetical protein HII31_06528, partial [Pseudocercospora fuligena]
RAFPRQSWRVKLCCFELSTATTSTTSNFHHIATTPSYLLSTSTDLPCRLSIPLTCISASYCAIAKLVTAAFERRRKRSQSPSRDDDSIPGTYTDFSGIDTDLGSRPPTNASTPTTIPHPRTAIAPQRDALPIRAGAKMGFNGEIVNGDGHHKKLQKRPEPSA